MTASTPIHGVNDAPETLNAYIDSALRDLKFGSVEITVHEGRVVSIERREKYRFQPGLVGRPDG